MSTKNLAEESPKTSPAGPPTLTSYADIPLDKTPGITGIFFPDGYVPSKTLNLILYFHGLFAPCNGQETDTIRQTWSNKYFPLRQLMNDSGIKNVVLVAPSLGSGADSGDLMLDKDKNGGDRYLTAVMAYVDERVKKDPFGWTGEKITIGSIILAGHSGGGKTILPLANYLTIGKVCEVWGLDSLYGGATASQWVVWANSGNRKFTLLWTIMGGTKNHVEDLLSQLKVKTNAHAAKAIVVEFAEKPKIFTHRTVNHCAVPSTFWLELMSRADCLKPQKKSE